ncbi:MAG: T9SS type A sorting domain-containing protein [Bacteroidota bacterium]
MMKRLITSLLFALLINQFVSAQVNYSEDIAPIIYNNCTSCHRAGEIGPFPLTNYNQVAAWGQMIKYVTEIKYMPPWKPDPAYSHFVGEKGLTDAEIQLIADWVDNGSPQGDPSLEPPLPFFPSGSQLGTPDLVLDMAEDYMIQGNTQDDYRVFVLPTGLTQDQEIAAVEFRPGNNRAVHHALLAYETNGQAAAKDAQDSTYGYEAFGSFGVLTQGTFTGYTPGIQAVFFPEGIGTVLPAGADFLMQIHYAPLPINETDRSSVNIFFKKPADPITREVQRMPVTPFDLDGGFNSFSIPPNQIATFHGTKNIAEDISLISVYPHCHYLGKDWEIYAVSPTNDTINIIRIEDWDFNWQGAYTFSRMKKIPQGSVMHIYASYDNTSANPFNPNNPPQTSSWGEGSGDEMYLVGTTYVPYQDGDEDIEIGGGLATSIRDLVASDESMRLFPNPGRGEILFSYHLNESQVISIDVFDIKGNLVKTLVKQRLHSPGDHQQSFDVGDFAAGVYSVRLRSGDQVQTRPLVVTK